MPSFAQELESSYNPRVAEAIVSATRSAPFPSLLGLEIVAQRPGYLRCKLPIKDKHRNGVGLVHGGVLTALVDHALSVVVYPHVEVGKWAATLDLKMSYLAPVRDGELFAEARIVSLRKTIGVVQIEVQNVPEASAPGGSQLVAVAMGTVYVKDRPK